MKIYPAIDLMSGACVRLSKGDFSSKKIYEPDPFAALARFERAGAEFAHVVDLDGAKDPSRRQTALLEKLARESKLELQVGGGVRSRGDVEALLSAGARRVVVGTLAVEDPAAFSKILTEFGGGRITLAVDAFLEESGGPVVASRGWTEKSGRAPARLIKDFLPFGLSRVLCTDIGRDGMLSGPNVPLYEVLSKDFPKLELQASGGVGSLEDLLSLAEVPVHSTIVGKALYEGKVDLTKAIERC